MSTRAYRAGQSVEDYCRACHVDRIHTVVVVDGLVVVDGAVAAGTVEVTAGAPVSTRSSASSPQPVRSSAVRARAVMVSFTVRTVPARAPVDRGIR